MHREQGVHAQVHPASVHQTVCGYPGLHNATKTSQETRELIARKRHRLPTYCSSVLQDRCTCHAQHSACILPGLTPTRAVTTTAIPNCMPTHACRRTARLHPPLLPLPATRSHFHTFTPGARRSMPCSVAECTEERYPPPPVLCCAPWLVLPAMWLLRISEMRSWRENIRSCWLLRLESDDALTISTACGAGGGRGAAEVKRGPGWLEARDHMGAL